MTDSSFPDSANQQRHAIQEAFREARSRMPDFNIQTLARQLKLNHGHIQAARVGDGVVGLALTPCDLVMRLPSLGALEITTTSPSAHLKSRSHQLHIAGTEDSSLSLRMLLPHWYWACLSREERPMIEVFDRYGRLLHCIASRADAPVGEGWRRIERLRLERSPAFTELVDIPYEHHYGATVADLPLLVDEWRTMRNETELGALLRRHHLRRIDAYNALENRFTQRMSPRCFVATLERAARVRQPLRLSVANAGAVHHHAEVFGHVGVRKGQIEAVGKLAELHVEQGAITDTWLITQPYADGVRTRLEGFGKNGRLIAGLSEVFPQQWPVSTMNAMRVFG